MDTEATVTTGEPDSGPLPTGEAIPGVRGWVLRHDESWLFIITYVTLAVVLSIWISVFWLVAVVGVHFGLELMRQRAHATRASKVVARALWEVKLDLALVLLALAMGVYMEFVVGAAGLGGAARLGAQGAARAAGWARALRGILLSLDDAAQVARAAVARKGSDTEPEPEAEEAPPWRRWSRGDHIAIWLGIACIVLMLVAPMVTDHTPWTVLGTLMEELHPWPGGDPASVS